MSSVEPSRRAQPVSVGRLKRLRLVGVALLVLAALVVAGWKWRHPSAFEAYGGWAVGSSEWRVGKTAYIGMTSPADQAGGTVRIHGAKPHDLADSTGAKVSFFICTPYQGHTGAAIGFVSVADLPKPCTRLVSDASARLSLATQQLVLAITPTRQGAIAVHGVDLRYSYGWQNGTQRVGGDVRIRVVTS